MKKATVPAISSCLPAALIVCGSGISSALADRLTAPGPERSGCILILEAQDKQVRILRKKVGTRPGVTVLAGALPDAGGTELLAHPDLGGDAALAVTVLPGGAPQAVLAWLETHGLLSRVVRLDLHAGWDLLTRPDAGGQTLLAWLGARGIGLTDGQPLKQGQFLFRLTRQGEDAAALRQRLRQAETARDKEAELMREQREKLLKTRHMLALVQDDLKALRQRCEHAEALAGDQAQLLQDLALSLRQSVRALDREAPRPQERPSPKSGPARTRRKISRSSSDKKRKGKTALRRRTPSGGGNDA